MTVSAGSGGATPAGRPGTGIVHLGLGAFFRAFGCVFVADAMAAVARDEGADRNWGIVGVSLRSPATRDALRGQGWAYSAVALAPDGETARRIDVLNAVLVAPEDPDAVLVAMADPGVRVVTLTVTEKGYCHLPATGTLDPGHPDIRHDLGHELPVSAPGFLVRALQRRWAAGLAPFTVLSCDNLPGNGRLVRGVVLDLARRIDPALADWIARDGRFPSTMVDRMTPATTEADIARIAVLTGQADAAPVLHEPFAQWVIEDDFVGGARPDFAAAGALMVANVTAHEQMKLRMLNGTHSALAYAGNLAGYETIADTVADPVFARFARCLWSEIAPTLLAPEGTDLDDYATVLFQRYANPRLRHRTWQIAMDGSQKVPLRLLATLSDTLAAHRPAPGLCLAVASWIRFVGGTDDAGRPIDVRDSIAGRLRRASTAGGPAEAVSGFLAMQDVFPAGMVGRLQGPLTEAAERVWSLGAKAAVAMLAP